MNKKLLIIVVLLLAGAGGAYKFVLAKPKEAEAKPKVEGTVYVLGKEFLVNLSEGRFAKLTVALVLHPDDHSAAPAGGGHGAAPKPPEGYGPMPQEALVRAIVTDQLTDAASHDLIDRHGREKLQEKILKHIHKHSDVHAEEVLFTDVTVQ
jgi:flagellar basal body-associated protein FliL